MQTPTEWMAHKIADAIIHRLVRNGESLQMFSFDRYNFVGEYCPPIRTRFMDDNYTFCSGSYD